MIECKLRLPLTQNTWKVTIIFLLLHWTGKPFVHVNEIIINNYLLTTAVSSLAHVPGRPVTFCVSPQTILELNGPWSHWSQSGHDQKINLFYNSAVKNLSGLSVSILVAVVVVWAMLVVFHLLSSTISFPTCFQTQT